MPEALSFPDEPRSELEAALAHLISQAERVRTAQGRLRALLHAVQRVVGEIELGTLLRRIVEASVDLVDAEYGALGVLDPRGDHLEQFIFVGLDEASAAAIGHLPRGHGLLGAVIDDPHPIRLTDLRKDQRSIGFPAHHPAMSSFLGVPVRVRGEVFGNLYLSNHRGGGFTDEDEQLLEALASTAGFAIQNARLFEEARVRERWMRASAELSAAILTSPPDRALDLIVDGVHDVSGAARVSISVVDGGRVRRASERGDGEPSAAESELVTDVLTDEGRSDAGITDGREPSDDGEAGRSPVLVVPLRSQRRSWGALAIVRPSGGVAFRDLDLEVASNLASQASLALELAHARAEQERAILTDERARIARDLHDHVIQQLFGAGLGLQAVASDVGGARERERITDAVRQIDGAISEIRTVIFALSSDDGTSVRHRLIDVVAEVSAALPRPPAVRFSGPIDHAIGDELADDLVAVARELLANSARHAAADSISVEMAVDDDAVHLVVEDDGGGIRGTRRSGLRNLEERAGRRGGAFVLRTGPGGTRGEWSAPLRAPRPEGVA